MSVVETAQCLLLCSAATGNEHRGLTHTPTCREHPSTGDRWELVDKSPGSLVGYSVSQGALVRWGPVCHGDHL